MPGSRRPEAQGRRAQEVHERLPQRIRGRVTERWFASSESLVTLRAGSLVEEKTDKEEHRDCEQEDVNGEF